MKTIVSSLEALPYFTITAVKQLSGENSTPENLRNTLSRWMRTGKIIQLKRGVYMSRRFFETHHSEPDFRPMISAIILPQSYLSLDFVLQAEGILTDVTYPVSAITPKQTRTIENSLGVFSYRNIKRELYSGFNLSEILGISIARASRSKALFDFLYFKPLPLERRSKNYRLTESLRLNVDDFSGSEIEEFHSYVEKGESRKMEWIFNHLRKTIWQT